ncbi:MAG: TetR/AcrR family transcriptional regulator C-terminal domain-containing protein [Gordonia sp. (in: high G+C Gram-positive bacteria)]|uniref:TetR/AcrR family transcriptional regulator C-terminal domain-containing protein n=1 Tax=Gordonia sp. (in: high G+C Gram-positive bacteria) TaxID=84139 RepID=UPI0039E47AA6
MAAKLTREMIVGEAFDLLDAEGIDGLTVRALATRLGVKAPALYWHVSSKQELLDQMGTEVARRIADRALAEPFPDTFEAALRNYALVMREEYLAHRDGARTFSGTRLVDAEVLRRQESALAHWTAAGVSLDRLTASFEALTAFVVGFVIEEQERADETRYSLADRDRAVGPDHPLTVAVGHLAYRPPADRFAAHLGVLVPALARPRD